MSSPKVRPESKLLLLARGRGVGRGYRTCLRSSSAVSAAAQNAARVHRSVLPSGTERRTPRSKGRCRVSRVHTPVASSTQLVPTRARFTFMSNTIDCSVTSHPACLEPEDPQDACATPTAPPLHADRPPAPAGTPLVGSYECINDCTSSLGVVSLLSSAVAGIGCYALPPACPAFITAVPLSIVQACDAACRELESK